MAGKIRAASGGNLRGKKIALLGLTFKAGTDDMRDAPSIALAQALVEDGASVHAYDPVGTERARPLLPECVCYHRTAFGAAARADAIVVVTEWDEFRYLDFARLKREMAAPLLVDLRNMFSEEYLARSGFRYFGVGNGSSLFRDHAAQIAEDWGMPRRRSHRRARDCSKEPIAVPLSQKIVAAE
jgi:UDPglucose 6-dehydrogenase